MKRLAVLAFAGSIVLGCSLTTRADDYFDPTGRTYLLGTTNGDAASKIAVAPEAVFVAAGTKIYGVSKSGDGATLVGSFSTAAHDVSTGRRGVVLVCSPAEGAQLFASAPPHAKQPLALPSGMSGCLSAAISEDRLLVIPEQDPTTGQAVFALAEGSAAPAAVTLKIPDSTADADPISAAVSGTVMVGLRGYVDRVSSATDLCLVAKVTSSEYYPPKIVAAGDSGTFVVRGGREDIRVISKQDACCGKAVATPCQLTKDIPNIVDVKDFAATTKYLYWLSEGGVHRRPLELVTKGDNSQDQTWSIANGVAIGVEPDDSVAYVAQGTNIVRMALP